MLPNQLTLALFFPITKSLPIVDGVTWLDVTDLATGLGFEMQTAISIALADSLVPISNETESHYDQRLYDVLWLAHFQLTMNDSQPTTFNFSFSPVQTKSKAFIETCLRLHVESVDQTTFLGLLEDF